MQTPNFHLIKTFLKEVVFESPNTPELFFSEEVSANMEINIDHKSKVSDGKYYLVELYVSLRPRISDKLIFGIKLTYSSLIEVLDKDVDQEELEYLLKVVIPQSMYDPLRNLVWKLTTKSGFPPVMMKDYDFATHLENVRRKSIDITQGEYMSKRKCSCELSEEDDLVEIDDDDDDLFYMDDDDLFVMDDVDQPSEGNIFPLSYDWVMEDICLDENGASFINIVKNKLDLDLSIYEETPLFKYFYRFLKPIEYNHPNYKECDDSYWPLLYQLLFAQCKNVLIVARDGGLPDIEFSYIDNERRTVSSLTVDELKYITSKLAVRAFAGTLTTILKYMPQTETKTTYADNLDSGHLILKKEFHSLYHTDKPDADPAAVAFVDELYARIEYCDLQTFPYRF